MTTFLTVVGLGMYHNVPYPGQEKKSSEKKGLLEDSSSSDSS